MKSKYFCYTLLIFLCCSYIGCNHDSDDDGDTFVENPCPIFKFVPKNQRALIEYNNTNVGGGISGSLVLMLLEMMLKK